MANTVQIDIVSAEETKYTIAQANTKLDKAIKSNPKGISKAVDNLEKAIYSR